MTPQTVWLLQANMINQPALAQMRDALSALRIPSQEVAVKAFAKDLELPPALSGTERVICWGPSFVPRVAALPNLSPGIWFDESTFRWREMQVQWSSLMLNDDAQVMTFANAVAQLADKPLFMRPDSDSKAFDGGLYDRHAPPRLRKAFAPDIATVIAPAKMVADEWRFFVVNGFVVAASSYRIAGKPTFDADVPEAAAALIKEALGIWSPADVVCIDVGFDGARYGIIEANCFNASRLYGADAATVVAAVTDFVTHA